MSADKIAFFNQVAERHDGFHFRPGEHPKLDRLRERLGDLAGHTVLEPGCGYGVLTRHLADWTGPTGRVIAFDNSPAMTARAREAVGARTTVTILDADAHTLAWPGPAPDLVLCFRVFPHFCRPGEVLRTFRSLVRPDGRLVIANFEGSGRLNAFHARAGDEIAHDTMPCSCGLASILADTGWTLRTLTDSDDDYFALASPS